MCVFYAGVCYEFICLANEAEKLDRARVDAYSYQLANEPDETHAAKMIVIKSAIKGLVYC